jgi:hypothetical protein
LAILAPDVEYQVPESPLYELWEENLETWLFFCKIQTQWRYSMAGITGLDYNVILSLANLYEVEDKKQLLTELQWIESTVLSVIAEQSSGSKSKDTSSNRR